MSGGISTENGKGVKKMTHSRDGQFIRHGALEEGGQHRRSSTTPSLSATSTESMGSISHSRFCSDNAPSSSHSSYGNTLSDSASHCSSSVKSGYDDDEVKVDNEDDVPFLCGCGGCTPQWLQCFHTARWLLTMLGICAFVQSFVVNGIFPVGLSTLEKRFHMTSTQTGIISSWYDFAVLIAVFPVCHWGNDGHKGRWIGLGTFLMGLGSFVCALPHYIVEPYKAGAANQSDFGQCAARDLIEQKCVPRTDDDSSYLNPYFLIFLLGQTLHGIGATPLFSIGTTYLDENVSQKASPVYLAIHSVVTSIGPIAGMFAGGSLLRIYTDFDRVNMKTVMLKGSLDPRWVGAWWLGFLGCSVAALLTAFPILMFARELPEAKRHRMKDVNQVHAVSQIDDNDDEILKSNVKTLSKAIWNILRNPTFVICIVLGIFESIVINGFAAFMPKILETILSTTPTNASYLSSVVIFAAAAGVMIGGVAIRQLNLQVGGMLKMILMCHVIALILIVSFLIQCPTREFVGITIGYNQQNLKRFFDENNFNDNSTTISSILSFTPHGISPAANQLVDKCNANCYCKPLWNPVCDTSKQQTYYSACYAGCKNRRTVGFTEYWEDCKCVASPPLTSNGAGTPSNVVSGFCTKECGISMWVFLVLLFFSVVASFASGIPSQQIMLRVIPFHQRTLGIGVHWTFLRLLGFIPGGILFGLMIDTTCLKWQESACGKRQSCLVHDPYKLSWTILAVAVVCKLVSILATIIGYMTYRPNDLDNAVSVMTTDSSRGPLSLTVNDDRNPKWNAYSKPNSVDFTFTDESTNAAQNSSGVIYVPTTANGKYAGQDR